MMTNFRVFFELLSKPGTINYIWKCYQGRKTICCNNNKLLQKSWGFFFLLYLYQTEETFDQNESSRLIDFLWCVFRIFLFIIKVISFQYRCYELLPAGIQIYFCFLNMLASKFFIIYFLTLLLWYNA